MNTCTVMLSMDESLTQAYDFPAFHFDLHLCRANLPPHTAVRGPGEIQATMLAEHIVEHVAARLGLDAVDVRERNFLQLPGAHPEERLFQGKFWEGKSCEPFRDACELGVMTIASRTICFIFWWCAEWGQRGSHRCDDWAACSMSSMLPWVFNVRCDMSVVAHRKRGRQTSDLFITVAACSWLQGLDKTVAW